MSLNYNLTKESRIMCPAFLCLRLASSYVSSAPSILFAFGRADLSDL